MSGWFKTLKKKNTTNSKLDIHKKKSKINLTQNTNVNNQISRKVMAYEENIRAARTFKVNFSPHFTTVLDDRLLMTGFTETMTIYNVSGKHIETVHAEPADSILSGLALNSTQNSLFVCDARGKEQARIQILNIYDDDIQPVVYIGQGLLKAPHGIEITNNNKILVTDVERKEVFIIQEDGFNANVFGESGQRYGQFQYPHDVVFDETYRRIIVSDTLNHRIQVFDENGLFIDVVEFDENGVRLFSYPTSMKLDKLGNLLVCDNGGDVLQVLDHNMKLYKTMNLRRMGFGKPSSVSILPFDRICLTSATQSSVLVI